MPSIEELINEKTKNKLNTMKNDFIGQTPNLNSSLGVNAFIGANKKKVSNFYDQDTGMWMDDLTVDVPEAPVDTSPSAPVTEPSKLDTFWTKNQNVISGAIDSLSGLFGAKQNTGVAYQQPTAAPAKKGMPVWAWILIAIVVITIIYFVVRSMKK